VNPTINMPTNGVNATASDVRIGISFDIEW
jgi:hypothetical protein